MHATVIGVADPAFSGIVAGYRPDVWMSLSAVPASGAISGEVACHSSRGSSQERRSSRRVPRCGCWIAPESTHWPGRSAVAPGRRGRDAGARWTGYAAAPAVRRPLQVADDDGRRRAAAGVRQHRQPAARARGGAAARDGGAGGARCRTGPHHAAGADRVAASSPRWAAPSASSARDRRDDAHADHDLGDAIAGLLAASG